jgi:hypothetical protein
VDDINEIVFATLNAIYQPKAFSNTDIMEGNYKKPPANVNVGKGLNIYDHYRVLPW